MERLHIGPLSRPPETPRDPMEFLCRSWSHFAREISTTIGLAPQLNTETEAAEIQISAAGDDSCSCLPSMTSSMLVMERIMSQSHNMSPPSSGRPSRSYSASISDSPPVSPSAIQYSKLESTTGAQITPFGSVGTAGGVKTVGRWIKDRIQKKKGEERAHNAQLHAAVSVAAVASAVAAIAAAAAAASSGSGRNEQRATIDSAVASAATLVAAQCVEAAESMGAEREHLTFLVSSAVNARSAGDIITLTAAAATALRAAATLKARTSKDVWNIAAVIPVDKGIGGSEPPTIAGEISPDKHSLGICNRELLKRTRKGDLHCKIVSVYINRFGQVILKMKSKHVAGTVTKKKKTVVLEVMKDIPAWPGRHLLDGSDDRGYFGLRTVERGVIEFECPSQLEYEVWTQGVGRLLGIIADKSRNTLSL